MDLVRDSRATRALLILGSLSLPLACSDNTERPPPATTNGGSSANGGNGTSGSESSGGRGGTGGSGGGATGQGGAGNASGGEGTIEGGAAGDGPGSEAGAGGSGPGEGGSGAGKGGSANQGGSVNRGGSSSEGGAAGQGGDITACATDGVVEPPAGLAGVCDPNATWDEGTAVPIPNAGTQLISITPDELTMLWYAETSGPVTSYVADRASADVAFDDAQDLPGRNALALSPDGLRLVAVSSDQRALSVLARAARGALFEAAGAAEFTVVNADAAAQDRVFVSVVISADDRALYYLLSGADHERYPLRVSRRSNAGPWPAGVPLSDCELEAHEANRRIPTGVSADGLTLFYYDEVTRSPRAAYRESANGPIVWVQTHDMRDAQPNEACDRLYFSGVSGPLYAASP